MQEILIELKNNPKFFIFVVGVLSLMVGSFLNVVIYRIPKNLFMAWQKECKEFLTQYPNIETLPKNYGIIWPASKCPNCQHVILAKDNIPILSYLLLRGKCRFCRAPISLRYPLIELITFVMSIIVALNFGYSVNCLFALLITWCLIAQMGIDLDHMLIPDNITLPMLWAGLLASAAGLTTQTSTQAVLGAAEGYLSLWSVYIIFKLCAKKEGMGHGDFKLLAMLGAWLGPTMLLQIILISSFLGSIVGLSTIFISKKSKDTPFPFGPYLAIAGWIALNWGDKINSFYMHNIL